MTDLTVFNYTGSIVTYTVPETGLYDIDAYGAEGGGDANTGAGGLGAEIGGDVMLTQGEVLSIAVGDAGSAGGGNGGGGSFVVGPGGAPLVIAGGGGGAIYLNGPGGLRTIRIIWRRGSIQEAPAGNNGNGGAGGYFDGGGRGGGLLTDGTEGNSDVGGTGVGGASFANGLAGGAGSPDYKFNNSGGNGGFGGGGLNGGGGGGATAVAAARGRAASVGGGSFDGGLNDANLVQLAGENSGDGSVVITLIQAAAVASVIAGTQGSQATTDNAGINPFAAVTITDPNAGGTETVTVTPDTTTNGVLSDPNAATDGSTLSHGIYTVTGSASAVSAALDGLRVHAHRGRGRRRVHGDDRLHHQRHQLGRADHHRRRNQRGGDRAELRQRPGQGARGADGHGGRGRHHRTWRRQLPWLSVRSGPPVRARQEPAGVQGQGEGEDGS